MSNVRSEAIILLGVGLLGCGSNGAAQIVSELNQDLGLKYAMIWQTGEAMCATMIAHS